MDGAECTIRVALVDDHSLVREGLRHILEARGLTVVGEAGDSRSAVDMVERERPEVLLLDVEIPGDGVTATVGAIREAVPETHIVILSMHDGPQLVRTLLGLGIRGYLLKSVTHQELVAAVRSIHADPSRVVLSISMDGLVGAAPTAPVPVLSERELDVLQLTAQALSNAQIGARLGLTEATVKRHLRNVFVKLGAVSRIDAVNKAVAASMILPPAPSADPARVLQDRRQLERQGRLPGTVDDSVARRQGLGR